MSSLDPWSLFPNPQPSAFAGLYRPPATPAPSVDALLAAALSTPPPAPVQPPPPLPPPPEKAPLVRLEESLARIRKVAKKGKLDKWVRAAWVTEVSTIFKAMLGSSGLSSTLEGWKIELAAGRDANFPAMVDDIEEHLETLLDMAEGDSLTKVIPPLPRTFVSFSSADIGWFNAMKMWQKNKRIPFNFCNCQLTQALKSEDEGYIKRRCKRRLKMAAKFVLLIGKDTKDKEVFVKWEVEEAIAKKAVIIAVNLDHCRTVNPSLTPSYIQGIGALFVPFSPRILALALAHHQPEQNGPPRFSVGN